MPKQPVSRRFNLYTLKRRRFIELLGVSTATAAAMPVLSVKAEGIVDGPVAPASPTVTVDGGYPVLDYSAQAEPYRPPARIRPYQWSDVITMDKRQSTG